MLLTLEALIGPSQAFRWRAVEMVCRWDGAVQSQHVGTGKLWAPDTGIRARAAYVEVR
jgi:hypothetical protein